LRLGVGIIASVAFNPVRDAGLQLLNTDHLFEEKQTRIGVRRGNLLRNYAFQFIELCTPTLTESVVRDQLALPTLPRR